MQGSKVDVADFAIPVVSLRQLRCGLSQTRISSRQKAELLGCSLQGRYVSLSAVRSRYGSRHVTMVISPRRGGRMGKDDLQIGRAPGGRRDDKGGTDPLAIDSVQAVVNH